MPAFPAPLSSDAAPAADSPPARPRDWHDLKQVPETRELRAQIRQAAIEAAARLDKSQPLARHEIEARARALLDAAGLPERYLGWAMVALATAFWRDAVTRIPPPRRLVLLPHCLRDADRCPAAYDELGLLCQDCGACVLSQLRAMAEQQGCRVLIAEGSPVVLQMILAGQADALLGVGCLNSLEKALDKILLAGLPCMAVPLRENNCRNTTTDVDWVREMIETPYRPGVAVSRTYVHLLRCAAGLFNPEELRRLAPRQRGGPSAAATDGQALAALAPLAATEAVAYDFLRRGGKRLRPFITLAVYDAMTGGHGAGPDGAGCLARLPDAVKRIALAMEVFHKASLVHDDIEDDDTLRYGQPTLHRQYGTAMAINVGDYLIGLGYRLVGAQRDQLPANAVADILFRLSQAHTKLCEGQGAELAWRAARRGVLAPIEALRIYALKTAPAFEAALYAGLRLATAPEALAEPLARFARHLGVAYQILNDLDDWDEPQPNKHAQGADVLGKRPTVLWALAWEGLGQADRRRLESLMAHAGAGGDGAATVAHVRELYEQSGVYEKAAQLVAKHRQRAWAVAAALEPSRLRELLHYFIDAILK